jgi:hypothetical protein
MAAQIRSGPRVTPLGDSYKGKTIIGKTVSEIRAWLSHDLQIPEGAEARVSTDGGETSSRVNDSFVLDHGHLLEFSRPAGTKG